jgi:hypothetical protein
MPTTGGGGGNLDIHSKEFIPSYKKAQMQQ